MDSRGTVIQASSETSAKYMPISDMEPLIDGFIRANQKIYVLLSPDKMIEVIAVEAGWQQHGPEVPVKDPSEQVVRLRRHLHDGIVTVRSF